MDITFKSVVDPIQMGASGANGIIGAITSAKQQKRQYKYNSMLQEQQAKLNMDAWLQQYEKQFEGQMNYIQDMRTYNSPTAQMDRLAQAGINPNFIAAGAINNTQTGMVSPSPSGSVAGSSSVGLSQFNPDLAGKYAQLRLAEASVEKLDTESDKNRAETGKIVATTPAEVNKLLADTDLLLSEKNLNESKVKEVDSNIAAIQQYTAESAARAESTLRNALVNEINQMLKIQQFDWQKQTDTKRLGYEFMEAQAAQTNASANFQNVKNLREKYTRELAQADQRIAMESARLEHEFEKDGVDALERAIDRSSIGIKGVARYTFTDDLTEQLALLSAGASYVSKFKDYTDKESVDAFGRGVRLLNDFTKRVQQYNAGFLLKLAPSK